jgi:hypothetical protein
MDGDIGSLSWLVRAKTLSASSKPVGVLENVVDVRRELVELVEGGNELSRLSVADLQLHEVTRAFETLQLVRQSVELNRLGDGGMLAHDHRDELAVVVLFARQIAHTN